MGHVSPLNQWFLVEVMVVTSDLLSFVLSHGSAAVHQRRSLLLVYLCLSTCVFFLIIIKLYFP